MVRKTPRARSNRRSRNGIGTVKRALAELGSRPIDRRTTLGKIVTRWRADLVDDLGGPEAISTQEAALIDLAVKSKMILDSVDAWLLDQPSLVNARRRALLPVVRERTQLADSLARYLVQLGLERRTRPPMDVAQYIAARHTKDREMRAANSCRHGSRKRTVAESRPQRHVASTSNGLPAKEAETPSSDNRPE